MGGTSPLGARPLLTQRPVAVTILYMSNTLKISLPPAISKELNALVKRTGKSRSAVVREAVRRQLALERFRALRERLVPKAQVRGIYTDEDVFKIVS